MKVQSRHLLAEYFDCDENILQNMKKVELTMHQAAQAAKVNVVSSIFHPFTPQGITGVLIIEESHFSIHTWPEYRYASVDFYTCGQCHPDTAINVIKEGLKSKRAEKMLIFRGQSMTQKAMKVALHKRIKFGNELY